jgi:hypothetical protein
VLQQPGQDLEGLLLQLDSQALPAQFARPQINLEDTKADATLF